MRFMICGVSLAFVAACGGETKPADTAVSATPGQLSAGAAGCGSTANPTQMMSASEVTRLTTGCTEAKASTASTETLKSNTDATCQASLSGPGQTCIEPYPGTPKKWGVWDGDKTKSADCYCAK